MNYSFTDYEDAVIAALTDLERKNGGYLAALEGYAGQIDNETAFKTWLGRFPAVIVSVAEAEYPEADRSNVYWRQDVRVSVLVGAQSWRGQSAARRGGMGGAQILADIRSRLLNKTLGLDIRGCVVLREGVLASDLSSVIYTAEYLIINDRILEELP